MPAKFLGPVLLLLASSLVAAPAPPKSALDKSVLEDYVRYLFIWGPQIDVKVGDPKLSKNLPGFYEVAVTGSAGGASKTETFYVSKDGQKIFRAEVYNVAKGPFDESAAALDTTGAPSFGPATAPVKIVVFSDFECGYCKEQSAVLRKNVATEFADKVQVFYMEYPLEAIHPWAKAAAEAARCVLKVKPQSYWDFHDFLFDQQAAITNVNLREKVTAFAASHSIDATAINSCLDTHATASEVAHTQQVGRAVGIDATPTLFINGRRIGGGLAWPNLQQIINFELDYRKAHPNVSSEKCCEITLPTPFNK